MPAATRRGSTGGRAAAAQPVAVTVDLDTGFSIPAIRRVVGALSKQQEDVVKSIGFGGLLYLHRYKRLDRHFAAWLAGQLVVSPTGSLFLKDGAGAEAPVTRRDVREVLGIPNGDRRVGGRGPADADADTAAVRRALGLDEGGGAVTLHDAEAVISRRKKGKMTQAERDAFAVAFVILVVGHFLAPPDSWRDKVKPEVFHAIANPSELEKYNWAEYVLEELRSCAVRVRQQIAAESTKITLSGCLLFLQIFYLERLDFAAAGGGVPRRPGGDQALVATYDDETLRMLIKEDLKEESCAGSLKQFGNLKSIQVENTHMQPLSQHGLPEIKLESVGWNTAHSKSLEEGHTKNSGSSSEETSTPSIWSAFSKVCTIL